MSLGPVSLRLFPIDRLLRAACSVLLPSMVLEFKAQKRQGKGDPGIHTDVAAMLRQWLQMLLQRAPSNRRITRDMAAVAPERWALLCMQCLLKGEAPLPSL